MVMNQLEQDPIGEVAITVPPHLLDDLASVIAIDIEDTGAGP